MKTRPIPTSPKNKKVSKKALDEIYSDEDLATIEKPKKSSRLNLFVTLVVAIIFGFLAGLLGEVILVAYGPEIPFLNRLEIFAQYTYPQSVILRSQSKLDKKIVSQIQAIRTQVSPSLVTVYEKKQMADDLSQVYLEGEQKGLGLIVSNDGVIITSPNVIDDVNNNFVVITHDKKIFEARNPSIDPLTGLVFFSIEADNLAIVNLADLDNINAGEGVLVIRHTNYDSQESVFTGTVNSVYYQERSTLADLLESTEEINTMLQVNVALEVLYAGEIVFDFEGKALGISLEDQNSAVQNILPFDYVKIALNQILSSGEIKRPYLGLHYIDIAKVVNFPDFLVEQRTKGAYIYSTDETKKPAIIPKSPAEGVGLKEGDIIIAVDKQILDEINDLTEIIQSYDVGEFITLTIIREDQRKEVKVELGTIK